MIIKIAGYPDITASEFTALSSTNTYQVTTISTVADVSGSLNNKYFLLPSANDATIYVVWFNVNSAGTPPNINNTTNVEIAVATAATADAIATEMRSVLGALSDFAATGATNEVILTFAVYGRGSIAQDDTVVTTASTGFTFADTTPGKISIPSDVLYKIVGKYWTDEDRIDASGTGSTRQIRFSSGTITIIVPIYRILEVRE